MATQGERRAQTRSALLDAQQTRIRLQAQQWVRQAALFKALGGA